MHHEYYHVYSSTNQGENQTLISPYEFDTFQNKKLKTKVLQRNSQKNTSIIDSNQV